jgi:hypothetical protein
MQFWDDLSPLVKRYLIVAVVLACALLAFRKCAGPGSSSGAPPPRGAVR